MKKLLSTFVFGLLLSGAAFAQTTLNASATVVADLTVSEERATDFAILEDNFATATIDPTDGSATGVAGGTVVAGLINVAGTAGSTVDVVTAAFDLTGPGAETLSFAPAFASTDTDFGSIGATFTATAVGGSFTLDGTDGISTVIVGGTLTASAPVVTVGAYSGTGSVTISYQ